MVAFVEPRERTQQTSGLAKAEVKPPRILMIGESLPIGADRRTWLQAASLLQTGIDVSLLLPQGDCDARSYEGLDRARILTYRQMSLPSREADARRTMRSEARLLGRMILEECVGPYSVSALSLAQPAEIAMPLALLGRLLRKPVIVDYRQAEPDRVLIQGHHQDSDPYNRALRQERRLLALASLVLCSNEAQLLDLHARRQGNRTKFVLVRAGPAPLSCLESGRVTPVFRRRSHLIAFCGPLTPSCGAERFVRAARRIVYGFERQDIQFVIAGSGPCADGIRDLVSAEGLGSFVECLPGDDPALVRCVLKVAEFAVDPVPRSGAGARLPHERLCEHGFGAPILTAGEGGVPELARDILAAVDKATRLGGDEEGGVISAGWANDGAPAYLAAIKTMRALDATQSMATLPSH